MGTKKTDLTIYLAKEEFVTIKSILKEDTQYSEMLIKIDKIHIGTLFIKKSNSSIPKWASLFSELVPIEHFGLNQSTGALLIIHAENRNFLLTFGHGRYLFKTNCIETNFGLKTALNVLQPESIRSLDKSSLEAQPKQAREQSGEAVGIQFFGVDIERDLLRAITGTPKNNEFGKRVSGGDPLKISVELKLKKLKDLLNKIWKTYIDEGYKQGPFAWIDHIGEVKDKQKIEILDAKLISTIKDGLFDKIWLCAPRLVDWDRVVGFKYSNSPKATRYHDTRILECVNEIGNKNIEIESIRRRKIYAVNADDYSIIEDSIYRFVYAEIEHGNDTHILNAGKWYVINPNYVQRISNQYKTIVSKTYKRNLLEYNDNTEADYNRRLAESNPSQFVLLDKKLIYLPDAASPVEPCDVYMREKEFIHVKRYGGSSVLSHLFNQGLISGELLQSDREFRKKFNEQLPESFRIKDIERIPERLEFTVVYAIVSEQNKGLNVPFFSKISLKHAVSRLEAFGFVVRLAKIPVADVKKKTKILGSRGR